MYTVSDSTNVGWRKFSETTCSKKSGTKKRRRISSAYNGCSDSSYLDDIYVMTLDRRG